MHMKSVVEQGFSHKFAFCNKAFKHSLNFESVKNVRTFMNVVEFEFKLRHISIGDKQIPMKQSKIRPSVTLYSFDRSLPNLARLITSVTFTQMPMLVKSGWARNMLRTGEI